MTARQPQLHIIAGPNGAGKTTFARTYLPHYAGCIQFVNVDLIAAGLSPFAPESASLAAGRVATEHIRRLSEQRIDFAIESTLAGRAHQLLLKRMKEQGYQTFLYFLWLPAVRMAIERVADRVRQGGHNVPTSDVRRRYERGCRNFLQIYRALVDCWTLFDNSGQTPQVLAIERAGALSVLKQEAFCRFLEKAGKP